CDPPPRPLFRRGRPRRGADRPASLRASHGSPVFLALPQILLAAPRLQGGLAWRPARAVFRSVPGVDAHQGARFARAGRPSCLGDPSTAFLTNVTSRDISTTPSYTSILHTI